MTSQDSSSAGQTIPFQKLPWILAAAFFLLYLITIAPGPGVLTLGTTAKITGWDWVPLLQYPLYFVVTLPVRILPDGMQIMGLNFLSAIMGALTIGLLARSVQLLPQDRTRDQRERERNELGILTGTLAWLPAVAAVIVGGLQLLFWQNATNASTEMLDLLVLALIIRELLEYRLDQKDKRLVRVALVYGLGITNNYALIALFPFTLGAMIWILGTRFFRSGLILKMLLAGTLGLLLYLLLPLLAVKSGSIEITFWEALTNNIIAQKSSLGLGWNLRLFAFVMSLGSLLPLILIGIRWPSSFGDTSAAGNFLTRLMFPVLVLLFIAGAVLMNLRLDHVKEAAANTGFGFHSLYYLSALVIGYSIGHLLVVFGKEPGKKWQQASGLTALVNKAMVGLAFVIPAVMLVILVRDNYGQISAYNRSLLSDYTRYMAEQLPEGGAIVLSDDAILLQYVRHHLSRSGTADVHWLLHSQSLNYPGYHHHLRQTLGDAWPELPADMVFDDNVEDSYIAKLIFTKGQDRPVRYLHPSFGYFFERMYPRASGLLTALEYYPDQTVTVPRPTEAEVADQTKLLQRLWDDDLFALSTRQRAGTAALPDNYLANIESKTMNEWGVQLRRNDLLPEATPWFERAVQLNTNNVSALINLEYNQFQLSENTNAFSLSEKTMSVLKNYRQNMLAVLNAGGQIDVPAYCLALGQQFAAGKNYRQAAQQYLRAAALTPNNQLARAQLVRTFLQAQSPNRALEMIDEIRKSTSESGLQRYAEIDLLGLEAGAYFTKGQPEKGIEIVETGLAKYTGDTFMRDTAVQIFLTYTPYMTNLLSKVDPLVAQQILSNSTNVTYQFNSGSVAMMKKDWPAAIDVFTGILDEIPNYAGARFNRAVARLQSDQLDGAREDYQRLLEEAPHEFKLHYGLGDIAERQNRPQDAVEHFEAYLKAAPRSTAEYTNVTGRIEKLRAQ